MGYYCNSCKASISAAVFQYSMDQYGRALCRACQPSKEKSPKTKLKPQSTPEAQLLFKALKSRGVPAKLELFDGFKHIDIAIPEAMVNIEVDGVHHNFNKRQALADLKRTFHSFKKGYVTLRIPNSLVTRENLVETADYIVEFLNESLEQMEAEDW